MTPLNLRHALPALLFLGALLSLVSLRADSSNYVGLWVGEAQVTRVSELIPSAPQDAAAGQPTPSNGVLTMRILVHVNAEGEANFLRWVSLMAVETSETLGSGSDAEETTLYRPILVTRKDRFFDAGVVGRFSDGNERTGQRFYTVSYDWNGSDQPEGNQRAMDGNFAQGHQVQAVLPMDARHPHNPFYHRYHARHYQGKTISRRVTLALDTVQEEGILVQRPQLVSGQYRDEIFGLTGPVGDINEPGSNDRAIVMEGSFTLERISDIATLNTLESTDD